MSDDRGAVAVLVALLAVALFGFGAIVIDVGALYAERRELQTGADAGSLAIAQDCAAENCDAASAAAASAKYADANAKDASAGIGLLCSNAPQLLGGTQVTTCAAPAGLPSGARFVTVGTITRNTTASHQDRVAPVLSGVLGYDGVPVGARSTAVWGGPGGTVHSSLPLTFSYCEWATLTNGGEHMPQWPITTDDMNTPAIRDLERKIVFFGGSSEDPELNHCRDIAAGTELPEEPNPDTPGGFGWADGAKENCEATTITNGTYEKESGNADGDCSGVLKAVYDETWTGQAPRLLYIPVYQSVSGGTYTLQTYVAFVLTGFRLGTGCGNAANCKRPSLVSNMTHPAGEFCNSRNWKTGLMNSTNDANNQNCITGFFVKAPPPTRSTVSGPSLGVTVYNLFN